MATLILQSKFHCALRTLVTCHDEGVYERFCIASAVGDQSVVTPARLSTEKVWIDYQLHDGITLQELISSGVSCCSAVLIAGFPLPATT